MSIYLTGYSTGWRCGLLRGSLGSVALSEASVCICGQWVGWQGLIMQDDLAGIAGMTLAFLSGVSHPPVG